MAELVACLSSAAYDDRPIAFTWEGYKQNISRIVAQWRTPGEKHFKVLTGDKQVFELVYQENPAGTAEGTWQVHPIQE